MNSTKPLLTIAVPTYNRAGFLQATLAQLIKERSPLGSDSVEILVSDNCSTDDTPEIIARARENQVNFRVIRNAENLGSDANIAQCFNEARGHYVIILGDDDMPCDGVLAEIVAWLEEADYGVVYLRAYGYGTDMRAEFPGTGGTVTPYADPGAFIVCIGPHITFISSLIINKDLLAGIDANVFCGGQLVQVHLALRAILAARRNLFVSRYVIAAVRNNSGGYDFAKVFVTELGRIYDACREIGLPPDTIRAVETRMMLTYFPYYLLRIRRDRADGVDATARAFETRFGKRFLFWIWLAPTLHLPRFPALIWGAITTALGRVAGGDLSRGLSFLKYRTGRTRN